MKSRITLRVPCKKSNSFPKRHGAKYDITSSLGDPGGVVGLAAVLSPTVAIALSGDPGGDFILGGDFDWVLSLSFPAFLSSFACHCSSLFSFDSVVLSKALSSGLFSKRAESEGPLSALLSLLNDLSGPLSWSLSALSGTFSKGTFSVSLSTLSISLSRPLVSTMTGGLSTLGSARVSWGRWLTSVKRPYRLMVILLYHPRRTTTSVAP